MLPATRSGHLRPDPNLPGLDMAWSPIQMAEFFNRSVLPATNFGQEVAEVRFERATYSPGKECAVVYLLLFGNPPQMASRCVVTFANNDKLGQAFTRHYQEGTASTQPALYLPEYSCLVEFFPLDWKLPGLARALDPREMAGVFSEAGLVAQNGKADSQSEIKVLAYSAHRRCVIHYRAGPSNGARPTEMLGKLYTSGPLACDVWRVMKAARAQGSSIGLATPRPLAVMDNLLLMEWLPGVPLNHWLEDGEVLGQAGATVRLAAEALSKLHCLQIGRETMRWLESDWERHSKRADKLHLVAPELAGQVDAVQNEIKSRLDQTDSQPAVFLHGDYKATQLLVDGGRVSVVDFDRANVGDPAIDVGNFMADLHREAVITGRETLRFLADYFLREYQACSLAPHDGLAKRARLMQSLALVRMAMRAFRHAPHTEALAEPESLAGSLLQEASDCLARL